MTTQKHHFVNVEAIDRTIRSIRRGPFRMSRWNTCICGHAWGANRGGIGLLSSQDILANGAAMLLGISEQQAADLFCSNLDATKAEAIKVLEILRDEGVVDWDRARGEGYRYVMPAIELLMPVRETAEDPIDAAVSDFDALVAEARAMAL